MLHGKLLLKTLKIWTTIGKNLWKFMAVLKFYRSCITGSAARKNYLLGIKNCTILNFYCFWRAFPLFYMFCAILLKLPYLLHWLRYCSILLVLLNKAKYEKIVLGLFNVYSTCMYACLPLFPLFLVQFHNSLDKAAR